MKADKKCHGEKKEAKRAIPTQMEKTGELHKRSNSKTFYSSTETISVAPKLPEGISSVGKDKSSISSEI